MASHGEGSMARFSMSGVVRGFARLAIRSSLYTWRKPWASADQIFRAFAAQLITDLLSATLNLSRERTSSDSVFSELDML
jgi:hypothetical protein